MGRYIRAAAPSSSWLGLYAQRFDTVELNNTFYRLPPESTVDGWRQQAPPGFVYAVKVGQFGSHRKKLREPEGWLGRHVERARLLGDHLGPNLVQLPPRWKRDTQRLDEFLDAAPGDIRWAVELRDPTWVHDDTFVVLARHGAALCIHDLLPDDHPWELTADWTYLRFHGPDARTRRYVGRYGANRLRRHVERLTGWTECGIDVFAYFNNDFNGAAVRDAAWFRDKLVAATERASL